MKKNKIISLDIDISFEEAMKRIAVAPKEEVEAAIKAEEEKKKPKKQLPAPKTQKLLPKSKGSK